MMASKTSTMVIVLVDLFVLYYGGAIL